MNKGVKSSMFPTNQNIFFSPKNARTFQKHYVFNNVNWIIYSITEIYSENLIYF